MSSSDLTIQPLPLQTGAVRRFLRAGHDLYRGDRNWVAPLLADQKKVFHLSNPFFDHASMQLWVARREGRDVGRIAGIIDRLYHKHQQDRVGFFGFFEAEADPVISRRLFATVQAWARQQGLTRLMGPVNPTTNDECGLLVDGFNRPPVFMMPYNPAYYPERLLEAGFGKTMDLLAYHIDLNRIARDRVERIRAHFRRRHPDIVVRPLRRRSFWNDLEKIRQVYNEAWQENWGFVPMTEKEIDFMARRLKPLLVEGLVWIAETEREPVGFLLAVPDFNEALQPLRGRLITPRLLGFLPYLLGWRMPKRARVIVLGVKDAHRRRGVESAMLADALGTGRELGLESCEASWILEDNHRMRRVIEALGGEVYKTYRLYERGL